MSSRQLGRHRRSSTRYWQYLESLEQRQLLSGSPPTISDTSISIAQNAAFTFAPSTFTSLYSDPDSDPMDSIRITQLPTFGLLTLNGAAVYTAEEIPTAQLSKLTYTPNTGFAGADPIGWTAYDGSNFAADPVSGSSTSATLTFNVDGVAPTLTNSVKATKQNTAVTFDPTDFTDSFNDPNLGANITSITITALPTNGTLSINGFPVTLNQVISADDNGTLTSQIATLQYTPNTDYTGADSFSWSASDGVHDAVAPATINITVVPTNALNIIAGSGSLIASGTTTIQRNNYTDFGMMGTVPATSGQSVTRTFSIVNNTGTTIHFTSPKVVTITGANAADFGLGSVLPTSLAPGAAATFMITFTPKAAGARSAQINIANDAGSPFTFAIGGTGVVMTNAANGLQIASLQAGTGTVTAPLGAVLTMEYTGYLMTGTRFDSSHNLDRTPFQFRLGLGDVISGWDNGLLGAKVGQKFLFIIPASLAYGSNPNGNIPANATLIFEVQCLAIALPMIGVKATAINGTNVNNDFLVTPGATSGNTIDLTSITLPSAQDTQSVTFTLFDVGYTYPGSTTTNSAVCYYPTTNEITLTGPNASNFTLTHTAQRTYTLINGDSFTVQFNDPKVVGTKSAVISVFTNDAAHAPLTFTVQGTVPASYFDFTANATFPTTLTAGATISLPVVVKNRGNEAPPTGSTNVDIQVVRHDIATNTDTVITTLTNQSMAGIGAGLTRTFNVSVPLPPGISPDTYNLVVNVLQSAGALVSELTTANNSATSYAPDQLAFTQNPTNVTAGAVMSPAIKVTVEDQNGNPVTRTSKVTLTIQSGPTGGKIVGAATATIVNGVATFPGLSFTVAGTYILTATDGAVTLDSASFTVAPAAAVKLRITQAPNTSTAGVAINPAVTVAIVDTYGNTVTTNTSTVKLALVSKPVGATLGASTVSVAAVAGVATFDNIVLTMAGSYSFSFTDGALAAASTALFTVNPDVAAKLKIINQPTTTVAGVAIKPLNVGITVQVLDTYGNLVIGDNSNVMMAVNTGPDLNLHGTVTVAAVKGIATFSTLSLNTSGQYTLTASDGVTTPANTNAFTINPAIGTTLTFMSDPTDAAAAANIATTPVTVQLKDQFGNVATLDTSVVTLKINSGGPAGAILYGTVSAYAKNGMATFTSLNLQKAGTYTLKATDGTRTIDVTNSFTVSPLAATRMAFETLPTGVTTSTGFPITVDLLDKYGNIAAADSSTVTLTMSTSPLHAIFSGTTTLAVSSGKASFTGLTLDAVGLYTLKATDTTAGILPITSGYLTIAAGATPTFSIYPTTPNASEYLNTTTGKGVFTISLDKVSSTPVTMSFTLSGNPVVGTDYNLTAATTANLQIVGNVGTITFPANTLSEAVSLVPVLGGVVGSDTVTITLNPDVAYNITPTKPATTITISGIAPASVAGKTINATVTSGAAPFPTTGTYQFIFSNDGRYLRIGAGNVPPSMGTYTYTADTGNTAHIDFVDATYGTGTINLTFTTPTSIAFTTTAASGAQAGTMTIAAATTTSYAPTTLDSRTATHVANFAAGPDFKITDTGRLDFAAGSNNYIDAGTNFAKPGTYTYEKFAPNIGLLNLTDNKGTQTIILVFASTASATYSIFNNTLGDFGRGSFTLAAPTAYAPASLSGRTANLVVTAGTGNQNTSGTYQLDLSANSSNYVNVSSSKVETGTYGYTKFAPNIGIISVDGGAFTVTVTFTSATTATYFLTDSTGSNTQRGTFTLAAIPATNLVPASIDTHTLAAVITSGTAPYAASGAYGITFASPNYNLTGVGAIPNSNGSFNSYEQFTPTIALISVTDSLNGDEIYVLTFSTTTKATFVRSNGSGIQRGSMTLT